MCGALYLWWFYAEGTRTTPAIRELPRQRAQYVIDNTFANASGICGLAVERRRRLMAAFPKLPQYRATARRCVRVQSRAS
jgi:hypothetical protein